jgi:flagellar hook-basal body complex protein FliE
MMVPTALNPALAAALEKGRLGTRGNALDDGAGADFGQNLVQALKEVNQTQMDSRTMQEDFMTNRKPVEVHDLMIAMEKASTSMQLTMSVRNKTLEAYQEISRMQI